RDGFGIFTQLGFIPPGLEIDALEVSKRSNFDAVRKKYPQSSQHPLIASSDAHYPDDVGAVYTLARMAEPSFEELAKALAGKDGREIVGAQRR
ncbi:MAG: hypothetical protein FJY85_09300, partial [Deltaproteobacteria bacterium]|nr:hypothetical protein [Deltaproteobacteria bacterium]